MGLEIDIGVKNAKVKAGLAQIRGEVQKFSGSITGMISGAFSVAGIVAFASRMREVQKEAKRFGASAETIQRVGKAAKESDVDFETLARSINKVTLEATKAARGGTEQAKMFKTLGINAAQFVTLGLDQKILVLSEAFKQSQGSGMGTAAMLDLLGEKGSQIEPLLAQGPKALAATMKDATVQTNATVAAFANLDRQLAKVKGTGARWLSGAVGGLQNAAAKVSGFFDGGNYEDAAKADFASENMRRRKAGQTEMSEGTYTANQWIKNRTSELRQKDENDGVKDANTDDDPVKPVDDFTKDADEKKVADMKKGIAEDEARNRADALTGEAKINELMQQRAELADKISEDTVAGLEAKKRDLELEHELQQLQKSGELRYKAAEEKRASALEKQYLENASPQEKKAFLQNKQQRLFAEATQLEDRSLFEKPRTKADALEKDAASDEAAGKRFTADGKRDQAIKLRNQADAAEKAYDPAKAVEKRTEAEGLQSEINGKGGTRQSGVALAVDSLQRAGGGGRAYGGVGANPAQKSRDEQTRLLRKIADALGKGEVTVGPPIREPY